MSFKPKSYDEILENMVKSLPKQFEVARGSVILTLLEAFAQQAFDFESRIHNLYMSQNDDLLDEFDRLISLQDDTDDSDGPTIVTEGDLAVHVEDCLEFYDDKLSNLTPELIKDIESDLSDELQWWYTQNYFLPSVDLEYVKKRVKSLAEHYLKGTKDPLMSGTVDKYVGLRDKL